jgi:hypothetical protein
MSGTMRALTVLQSLGCFQCLQRDRDRRSSLLRKVVTYGRKKFYNIGTWSPRRDGPWTRRWIFSRRDRAGGIGSELEIWRIRWCWIRWGCQSHERCRLRQSHRSFFSPFSFAWCFKTNRLERFPLLGQVKYLLVTQWKRITCKQSARWQHLPLFFCKPILLVAWNATTYTWDWLRHLEDDGALWGMYGSPATHRLGLETIRGCDLGP